MNSRKTIENLLELNRETLSIPTLCLSLQCTGVQSLAEKILQEYQGQAKVVITYIFHTIYLVIDVMTDLFYLVYP